MNIKRWLGVIFLGSFIGLPAYAGPITIEQSSSFASGVISGCLREPFTTTPTDFHCDTIATSQTTTDPNNINVGAGGTLSGLPGAEFGLSVGLFTSSADDNEFELLSTMRWEGRWFDGLVTATVGHNSVFVANGASILSAGSTWTAIGADTSIATLSLRDLTTGQSFSGTGQYQLEAGHRYSVNWFVSVVANLSILGFGENSGTLGRTSFGVVAVPEPGTLILFVSGLIGIGLARRKKKV